MVPSSLAKGDYTFTCTIWNQQLYSDSDSVVFTVTNTEPYAGEPSTPITVEYGTSSKTITWDANDPNDPNNYRIRWDYGSGYATLVGWTTWTGGSIISPNIIDYMDIYGIGTYEFKLEVDDTDAQTDSDIVSVDYNNGDPVFTDEWQTPSGSKENGVQKILYWRGSDLNLNDGSYTIKEDTITVKSAPWTYTGEDLYYIIPADAFPTYTGFKYYDCYIYDDLGAWDGRQVAIWMQNSVPVVVSYPSDFYYTSGATGNWLTWQISDFDPYYYYIEKSGSGYVASGSWTDGQTSKQLNIDGLGVGLHNYRIVLEDDGGQLTTSGWTEVGVINLGISISSIPNFQYSDSSQSVTNGVTITGAPSYGNDVEFWVWVEDSGNSQYDLGSDVPLFGARGTGWGDNTGQLDGGTGINDIAGVSWGVIWPIIGDLPGSWNVKYIARYIPYGVYTGVGTITNGYTMIKEDIKVYGKSGGAPPYQYGDHTGGTSKYYSNIRAYVDDYDSGVGVPGMTGVFYRSVTTSEGGDYELINTDSSSSSTGRLDVTGTWIGVYPGTHYIKVYVQPSSRFNGGWNTYAKDTFYVTDDEPNPENYEDAGVGSNHPTHNQLTTTPGDVTEREVADWGGPNPQPVQDPAGTWRLRQRQPQGTLGEYVVANKWTTGGQQAFECPTSSCGADHQYWSFSVTRQLDECGAWVDFYPIIGAINKYVKIRLYQCSSGNPDIRVYVNNGGTEALKYSYNMWSYTGARWSNEWNDIELHTWVVRYGFPIYRWDLKGSITVRRNGYLHTSGEFYLFQNMVWGTLNQGNSALAIRGGFPSANYLNVYWDNLRYGTTSVGLEGISINNGLNATTESVLCGAKAGDLYLTSTTFNIENATELDWQSTSIRNLNQTQMINNIDFEPLMLESLGNNMYKSWHLFTIPDNQTVGDTELSSTYKALINGSWVEYIIKDNFVIYNTTEPSGGPLSGIYDDVQSLYINLNSTNISTFNYEEKITLMTQLKYILDMSKQGLYNQLGEYLQGYDAQERVNNQLNPTSPGKIALVTGISDYDFTSLGYIPPIDGDYLHQIKNLTDSGYHVYWLTDEYLTPNILSMVIARIDLNEDINTTIYYSYTGHARQDTIDSTVNGTQRIVLTDGTEMTDQELASYFSVWESEKQFFMFNTCFAEGIAYELQKQGRMILSSTAVDEIEYVPIFATHTPFYHAIIDNWNWALSVEENYIILCIILERDPLLYDPDVVNDFYL